jgi:hypothetical protein
MTDAFAQLARLQRAKAAKPEIVDVPETGFLMIDGEGDPAGAAYAEAVEALYSVAYGLRFHLKREGTDFKVMPLEGRWATEAAGDVWASRDRWQWTMMIAEPDAVTAALVESIRESASKRRPNPSLPRVRLERFAEGKSAQVLHVGPYGEAERPSVEALHRFIAESGLVERGRHHEIYLNDPRRTDPERLRTILRHPVAER